MNRQTSVTTNARQTLALIEGFRRPPTGQAHGTHQAAFLMCQALAGLGRYEAIHLYQDRARNPAVHGEVVLPRSPATKAFEKTLLRVTRQRYAAIYVSNGDQILCAPHVLRPHDDWAPVICSVGTAHANAQWSHLLLSLVSGALRPSDGLIFKSAAAMALFQHTLSDWSARLSPSPALPRMTVIPNGVDVQVNRRSEERRRQTRSQLGIGEADITYLMFSRLDPGTKGDLDSLVIRWKEVVAQVPSALLLLAGAAPDRWFLAELRQLTRAAGVGDRVLVLDNPAELGADVRGGLMSAADVFVHLSTGVEEASALAVHEALAHALPVITTSWAGMPEVVAPEETGFLVETRSGRLAAHLAVTMPGQTDRTHLIDAARTVYCDFPAFVRAAVALSKPERRLEMGAAARRRAEMQDIHAIARRYVEFFDATGVEAESAWTGATSFRPLVDLNDVIAAQASRRLEADVLVRLGDDDRLRLLRQGFYAEAEGQLQAVMACFEGSQQVPYATLAAAAARFARASHPGGVPTDDDLGVAGRLLIRLLNCGALELA